MRASHTYSVINYTVKPFYGMTRQGNLIGKKVSEARARLSLSQAALAASCQRKGWDLSRDVLARIESGVRGITDKEIAILCDVLQVPGRSCYRPVSPNLM